MPSRSHRHIQINSCSHINIQKNIQCVDGAPPDQLKNILLITINKSISIQQYFLKEHVFLQQCCQAAEEGMISTLVGWDTDALRRSILAISNFLFGYVNANQAQLINPTFLNK